MWRIKTGILKSNIPVLARKPTMSHLHLLQLLTIIYFCNRLFEITCCCMLVIPCDKTVGTTSSTFGSRYDIRHFPIMYNTLHTSFAITCPQTKIIHSNVFRFLKLAQVGHKHYIILYTYRVASGYLIKLEMFVQ